VAQKSRIFTATALALVVLATAAACSPQAGASAGASGPSSAPNQAHVTPVTPTPTPTPAPTRTPPAFDKHAHSINKANNYWVVVNKLRPLNPKTYSPSDIINVPVVHDNPPRMRKAAGNALVKMFAAGKKAGAGAMQIQSAWRPYSVQVSVYNGWVASLGKKQADLQSARPGYSEHQTGLAVDISPVPLKCALAACFGTTPQGKWLAANSWKYGYILRYPKGRTAITGYVYEPWHFRFVGTALSTEYHLEGATTLEGFFGLPAAPDYAN
jgi:D-alanyl-D-alanine carboxypeptidase